jgi:hypothetical protein
MLEVVVALLIPLQAKYLAVLVAVVKEQIGLILRLRVALIRAVVVVVVQIHGEPLLKLAVQALSFFATPAQFNISLVAQ